MNQRALFTAIAILIPVIFFVALEAILRLTPLYSHPPLFIQNPTHPAYLLPKPDIIDRYFPAGYAPNVSLEPTFFLRKKPDNGFRIVVQGGSTAAGFPYGLGASIAGMLESRLRQSFPDHHVEVINTAMSAVNSYLLNDFADEIIAQSPDLVVIYAGHNEYLGLFGVGSSFGVGGRQATSLYFSIRKLALVQAITRLYYSLLPPASSRQNASRTLMSQVAQDKEIVFGSPGYKEGLAQFEGNMGALLRKYRHAGIPVVISTIGSNERDLPPFGSVAGQFNASDTYAKGKDAYKNGQFAAARDAFVAAKDFDTLRFRAPSDINSIILRLAEQQGVYLADSYEALKQQSQNGIIGNELMLEHLHPNVPGYFIIADSIYKRIVQISQINPAKVISTQDAWPLRPLIPAEEYTGFARIQTLKADYPFTDEPRTISLPAPDDEVVKLGYALFHKQTDWLSMMKQANDIYKARNDNAMHLKTTLILADALPHEAKINQDAATLLFRARRQTEAEYYSARARLARDVHDADQSHRSF